MMFVRSAKHPFGKRMPRATVRALFIGLYTLYPLGCALQLIGPSWLAIAGLIMVAAALAIFAVLAGSSMQRQSEEPDSKLDERELAQRNRAARRAFGVYAGIVLLGLIYLMVREDLLANDRLALWAPSDGAHWNGIFWGMLLLALTLPAAFLAFEREPPETEEDEA